MPRGPRKVAESGFYHVVMRGNGRQIIFADDSDRRAFLELCCEAFLDEDCDASVLAWCLMDNHVHLLLRGEIGDISSAIRKVCGSYAIRFNAKEGRCGHLFQDRFGSSCIEDDGYLLEAVRYIHNNPQAAGICLASEYRWSSYAAYTGGRGSRLTDTELILGMLGGPAGFASFCASSPSLPYFYEGGCRPSDAEASVLAVVVLEGMGCQNVKLLPAAERGRALALLHEAGLSARQIERVTGVGRNAVAKASR